jgi:hypothetical protein
MKEKRVPFESPHDFDHTTDVALWHAEQNADNLYGALLSLLEGCSHSCSLSGWEQVGASYRTLERVANAVQMTEEQRTEWIALAESIPLSERHSLFVLGKLEEREAAA